MGVVRFEPIEYGVVGVAGRSHSVAVARVERRLLGGFDFPQAGVLQIERQMDQIPQVVVAADVGLVEHAVQIQLDRLIFNNSSINDNNMVINIKLRLGNAKVSVSFGWTDLRAEKLANKKQQ